MKKSFRQNIILAIPISYTTIISLLLLTPTKKIHMLLQNQITPINKIITVIMQYDKLTHFSIFFIMTLLYYYFTPWKKLSISVAITFFFCIASELTQLAPVLKRSSNMRDLTANMLGVVTAVLATKLFSKITT